MAQSTKLQQTAKAKLELIRKTAWNDFYIFSKYVCGRAQMEEQPHREVCEFLTLGIDKTETLNLRCSPPLSVESVKKAKGVLKKLLMLPRGTFKSTIASNAYPIWLLWHNPDLRIMIDSETLGNAKMYLAGIRDMIENNEMLKMICVDDEGNYLLEPNKSIAGGFTEEQVILKCRKKLGLKEPSLFCSGVDNARTGMHPDVIIMDDLVSERNVGTESQIEKTKDHYRYSLSLLEPGGLQIVIGTRYHMADPYGDLLNSAAFDILVRPAIDEKGELFFPARLTKAFLDEQLKSQGSYIFSCQYMLSPVDEGSSIFKGRDIQYYVDEPKLIEKYITVDLAISQKDTADYFVCMCTGIDAEKNLYVIDYVRDRLTPKQQVDTIFKMYDQHHGLVKAVGVESVAFQKAMLYLIKDEMKRTGKYMVLKELKADKDKVRRAQSLQPLFEQHKIFIKLTHTELKQELIEFPIGVHDDTVDCLAYVLQLLRPGNVFYKKREYSYKASNQFVNY